MKADPKQENLSWRGEFAYLRKKQPGGTEQWKSLGKLAPEDARRIVKHMIQKLNATELQIKLGMIARRSSAATIGEVIKAYDHYTAGVDIDPATVHSCKNRLRLLVRSVKGDTFDVDSAPVDILNELLVRQYSAAVIIDRKAQAKLEQWDAEKYEAKLAQAQRTIRSTVQQARSIFSADARKSPPYRALDLPDLTEFLEVKVGESTLVAYDPPPAAVLERIRQDVPALKLEDPAAWLAMQLEVNGGLRRGSAVQAKWDWFNEHPDKTVDLAVRRAKGGHSLLRFDWDLFQDMKATRQDLGEYVVPGMDPAKLAQLPEKERPEADLKVRQVVFDRLLEWLRARGLDKDSCRMPNHALRKWFGDTQYQEHGATAAQNALGHSTAKLTSTVYSQRRTKHAVRVM